jgi:hypothetical protein
MLNSFVLHFNGAHVDNIQSKDSNLKRMIQTGPDVPLKEVQTETHTEPSKQLLSLHEIAAAQVADVPEQQELYQEIIDDFDRCQEIAAEKVALVERVRDAVI